MSDELYLSDMERLELRCLEAEAKCVQFETRIKAAQRLDLLMKIDPDGKLAAMEREILALNQQHQARRQGYSAVIARIEKRLGIKMAHYGYDDETGLLHANDPTGGVEP